MWKREAGSLVILIGAQISPSEKKKKERVPNRPPCNFTVIGEGVKERGEGGETEGKRRRGGNEYSGEMWLRGEIAAEGQTDSEEDGNTDLFYFLFFLNWGKVAVRGDPSISNNAAALLETGELVVKLESHIIVIVSRSCRKIPFRRSLNEKNKRLFIPLSAASFSSSTEGRVTRAQTDGDSHSLMPAI